MIKAWGTLLYEQHLPCIGEAARGKAIHVYTGRHDNLLPSRQHSRIPVGIVGTVVRPAIKVEVVPRSERGMIGRNRITMGVTPGDDSVSDKGP